MRWENCVKQNVRIKASLYFYSPFYKVTSTDWSQLSNSWVATLHFRGLIDASRVSLESSKDTLLWSSLILGEYGFMAPAWWVFALEKLWDLPLHGCMWLWESDTWFHQINKLTRTAKQTGDKPKQLYSRRNEEMMDLSECSPTRDVCGKMSKS